MATKIAKTNKREIKKNDIIFEEEVLKN